MRRLFVRMLLFLSRVAYAPKLLRFEAALANPEEAQTEVLVRILKSLKSDIKTIREFQRQVPISDYEEFERKIETLVPDICFFEKTSGSRGPAKLIPYNKAMLKTFENMFVLWALDLLRSGLNLETGRVFFLITPGTDATEHSKNGTKIGLEDDSIYLGRWIRNIAGRFFVYTNDLKLSSKFIEDLAERLVETRDLEVISIWSPSLLILVCEQIANRDQSLNHDPDFWRRVWPKLKLISCWDSAWAEADAAKLKRLFPHVHVQGKGLLATEGAMTLPWSSAGGSVPLVQDLFFEFEDEETKSVRLVHELEFSRSYQILLTAPNGFLRYRIGDRVEVSGRYLKTPILRFLGRTEKTVDMVGEKMSASFAADAVQRVFGSQTPFALLIPKLEDRQYRLLVDSIPTNENLNSLANKFENELCRQHHYRLARQQSQLAVATVVLEPKLRKKYYDACGRQGATLGSVKHAVLLNLDQSRGLDL